MRQEKWLAPAIFIALVGTVLPGGPAPNFPHRTAMPYWQSKTTTAGLQRGSHKARLNGVEISYTVSGNGPIMFVQGVGWGPDSRLYQNTMKSLETRLTLVYIDPRGTGEVEPVADSAQLSSDRMAEDLEALRKHLGLGKIALMGHAHGGFVAMKYALKYPNQLSHLILVSSALLHDLEADIRAINENLQSHPRRKDPTWEEALARFKNEYDARTSEALQENVQLTAILYFYYYSARQRTNFEAALQSVKFSINNFNQFVGHELQHYNLEGQESRIAAPTLLIYGMYDPYFIRAKVRSLHWTIRNSKLELFERSGHYPWIEESGHFAEVVKAFVSPPVSVVKEGGE
jgi:pimeloyl-ACP methyl ester carboxylesterase